MSPQPLVQRLDKLEKQMADVAQLVPRFDALSAQFSQFQTEVRVEFSAVRSEMRTLSDSLRAEMRAEIQALGEALTTRMQVLHEDVVSRIAVLGDDRPRGRRATATSAARRRRP